MNTINQHTRIYIGKDSLEHLKDIVDCRDIHFEQIDISILDSEYPRPTKKLALDIE